jgi:hypothetical protein
MDFLKFVESSIIQHEKPSRTRKSLSFLLRTGLKSPYQNARKVTTFYPSSNLIMMYLGTEHQLTVFILEMVTIHRAKTGFKHRFFLRNLRTSNNPGL